MPRASLGYEITETSQPAHLNSKYITSTQNIKSFRGVIFVREYMRCPCVDFEWNVNMYNARMKCSSSFCTSALCQFMSAGGVGGVAAFFLFFFRFLSHL